MVARFNVFNLSRFQPNARYLIIASGIFSISFFGIQMLLKVLYMLRLGYGLEYIGLFSAVGALMYMGFSLPSGALGVRFGLYPTMFAGGVITTIGMFMLPMVEFLPPWWHGPWPILSQMVLTTGWSLFGINQVPALMVITTPQNRDSAYALNSVLRGMGAFIGTVIGGLLPGLFAFMLHQNLDAPAPYRYALWLGGALTLLGFVPLSMIRRVADVQTEQEITTHAAFPALMVGLVALFVFLAQAGSSTCQAFCSAYMDTDLALTPAAIGLLTGFGQLAAIFAPLLTPALAARRSNGWTLLATTLGMTIFMAPWCSPPTGWAQASGGSVCLVWLQCGRQRSRSFRWSWWKNIGARWPMARCRWRWDSALEPSA
ncbi:MAG: MFS transporter [Caldilineaceae bacterium]|nr:MFS transporter [Caldilineaceae bacterium]